MDKFNFLHRLKHLVPFRSPAQTLYQACTKSAQILRGEQQGRFCTFVPVDMHGLVHSLFGKDSLALRWRWRATTTRRGSPSREGRFWSGRTGSELGSQQVVASAKKKFIRPRSFRFQVYKQYRYTSIVIVLTQAIFCG